MTPATVEEFCLTLPGAALSVQWGGAHVFKVGGKIFAILAGMSRGAPEAWFKASEFSYILLVEQPGIRPAPYLARAKWVAAALGALPADDLQAYLREAHRLVLAKLTRTARAEILGAG